MAESDAVVEGAEPTSPVEDAAGKKDNSLFVLILVPLMILSAVGGGFLAYSQYPMFAEIAATINGSGDEEEEEAPIEFGEFMELTNIIVNPVDSEGRRLLMLSVGMETAESSVLESVTAREMVVRDTIIKILGTRTVDELADIESRTMLKDEIRLAVNGILSEGEINRMYFTQYVLQ
ncbi:MAG: flagellar basal body-associated protein FliL [Rhodothermales bacterium]